LKEKNYFFKMGKYQQRLIDYINAHPDFIRPEHRKNEILGFLRQPLGDLCISRPKARMSWGIEIPFDKEYVTYVWFDALINYISVPGYGADEKKFKKWWPADIHLIGKDILTTHAVYWPTMLFSLGIDCPKTIFAHGWWLIGESKMSKSLGNVVNPLDLIDQYGVDPVRYYLMSEMVLGSDANFTMELFIKRFNSDLANDYGNLLNRVSGLIQKLFGGKVPAADNHANDGLLAEAGSKLKDQVPAAIAALDIRGAIEAPMNLVRMANRYLEEQAPWKVAKEDLKKAGGILYAATESLRLASIFLSPVMPSKCERVLEILGAQESKREWGGLKAGTQLPVHEALFPRIDITVYPPAVKIGIHVPQPTVKISKKNGEGNSPQKGTGR
jgi:methionyl-tRNA synthetase